ncbi:MAG: hypothetical protein JWP63_3511 [Candidatus Solibacter sp.]|nr:hypothetical protein [Candidatus Solibacter sp.]
MRAKLCNCASFGGLGILCLWLAIGSLSIRPASAQPPPQPDLRQLDVEDLMNLKVTSVSKSEQSLSRTAAAIWVINQEDIRRSGATNVPDLLRMAPGVDVEQINANEWAISVRGFNLRYSNKVLVLIDGRTVYTPSFSGVFWEQIDMPLGDIDRIEVIRGPGASVWGANAVNGVISIFTKSAKETKGGQVTAGGGSQVYGFGQMRYGGAIGKNAAYRVWGKAVKTGDSGMPDGSAANDHWGRGHGGFRADWDATPRDAFSVQGELFGNETSQTRREDFIPTPFQRTFHEEQDAAGGNLVARWDHTLAGGSEASLQAYYDRYRRTDIGVPETLRTLDVDFQHHFTAGDRQDIVWGLGYRNSRSGVSPGYAVSFRPPFESASLFSGFLQDQIRVTDSFWLTLGFKLEHNRYTGLQAEPSIRMAWNRPGSRHAIWAAASKANRQPSRADTSIESTLQTLPLGPDLVQVVRMYGNPNILDEELRDYELGYRSDLTRSLSADVVTFLSFYRHLETIEQQAITIVPGSPTRIEVPLVYANKARAVTYGGEISLNWRPFSRLRIRPGYSYLHATLRRDADSRGLTEDVLSTGFPQNIFELRSSLNLPGRTEFDQALYYTARLPGGSIPGHARLDLRLGRRLGESTEVSIVGQNLLRNRTTEYGDSFNIIGAQVLRSIFGQVTWRF